MRDIELTIVVSREQDGRWFAEALQRPGAIAYGLTPHQAVSRLQATLLAVLAQEQMSSDAVAIRELRFEIDESQLAA